LSTGRPCACSAAQSPLATAAMRLAAQVEDGRFGDLLVVLA
jgi:hypothetical protein